MPPSTPKPSSPKPLTLRASAPSICSSSPFLGSSDAMARHVGLSAVQVGCQQLQRQLSDDGCQPPDAVGAVEEDRQGVAVATRSAEMGVALVLFLQEVLQRQCEDLCHLAEAGRELGDARGSQQGRAQRVGGHPPRQGLGTVSGPPGVPGWPPQGPQASRAGREHVAERQGDKCHCAAATSLPHPHVLSQTLSLCLPCPCCPIPSHPTPIHVSPLPC